jgi:hypothetical protein
VPSVTSKTTLRNDSVTSQGTSVNSSKRVQKRSRTSIASRSVSSATTTQTAKKVIKKRSNDSKSMDSSHSARSATSLSSEKKGQKSQAQEVKTTACHGGVCWHGHKGKCGGDKGIPQYHVFDCDDVSKQDNHL